jgi:hypothetical protein
MRKAFALIIACALALSAFAESPVFQGGIDLGTDVLPTGDPSAEGGPNESWTRLGFQPDVAIGKFGIGLDLTIRFKLFSDPSNPDNAITVYAGDWVPNYDNNGKNFIDVYLPKFLYIRYGIKGADPLFAKLGSINDLTLGNGFILGNYSNMHFMPELRIVGLDMGLDGAMFDIPYVGFELLTGNLARLDILGGRVYSRPLSFMGSQILKQMQVGGTFVMDTQPALYEATATAAGSLSVFGLDVFVPILGSGLLSMAAFTDIAFEPNQSMGAMLGIGGKLISFFNYGLQARYLGAGFIPVYFDANYDLYRALKYNYMQLTPSGEGKLGWYASLGTNIFKDKIVFVLALDGSFAPKPATASKDQTDYPHLRGVFRLAEGLIPGISANASYEKYFIGRSKAFFADLVDPTDAVIGMAIDYATGSALLTLKYDVSYVPDLSIPLEDRFKVRSSLSAAVKF